MRSFFASSRGGAPPGSVRLFGLLAMVIGVIAAVEHSSPSRISTIPGWPPARLKSNGRWEDQQGTPLLTHAGVFELFCLAAGCRGGCVLIRAPSTLQGEEKHSGPGEPCFSPSVSCPTSLKATARAETDNCPAGAAPGSGPIARLTGCRSPFLPRSRPRPVQFCSKLAGTTLCSPSWAKVPSSAAHSPMIRRSRVDLPCPI